MWQRGGGALSSLHVGVSKAMRGWGTYLTVPGFWGFTWASLLSLWSAPSSGMGGCIPGFPISLLLFSSLLHSHLLLCCMVGSVPSSGVGDYIPGFHIFIVVVAVVLCCPCPHPHPHCSSLSSCCVLRSAMSSRVGATYLVSQLSSLFALCWLLSLMLWLLFGLVAMRWLEREQKIQRKFKINKIT